MSQYVGEKEISIVLICLGAAFTVSLFVWFFSLNKNKRPFKLFLVLLFISLFMFGYGIHLNVNFIPYEVAIRNKLYGK